MDCDLEENMKLRKVVIAILSIIMVTSGHQTTILASNEIEQEESIIFNDEQEESDDVSIEIDDFENLETDKSQNESNDEINENDNIESEENDTEDVENFTDESMLESNSDFGTVIANGTENCGIMWSLYDDGTLVLNGNGVIPMLSSWHKYKKQIKTVIINDGISSIGEHSFLGYNNLCKVMINCKITEIKDWAFTDCISLTDINIPESVTTIGEGAFKNCENLKQCTIPEGVVSIGESAFSGCSSLENITIPTGISKISNYTFQGCANLKRVNIPLNVLTIGKNAFSECKNLEYVNFSEGLTYIGWFAFHNCNLVGKITFPDNLEGIGAYAFDGCENIESIVLPVSIENIDTCGFGIASDIKYVFFKGTKSQWEKLKSKCGINFYSASIHYNTDDHIWNDLPTVDLEPTCAKTGIESIHCNICGAKKAESETILPVTTSHKYRFIKCLNTATVFAKQRNEYICTVCNKEDIRSVGNMLNPTLKVNVNTINLKVKQKVTCVTASGWAAGDKIVSWKSSNNNIVKVNGNSKGKSVISAGKKSGKANIIITLKSGYIKQIPITVQKGDVKTTKILGVERSETLNKGEKFSLTPRLVPIYSSQKITYASSNKKVATVNAKGVIKACGIGKATITVKSGKKRATCKIRVVYQEPDFDAYLAGYNTRDNYFVVKYHNNSNKTLTVLPGNAQVWDMDYRYYDRNLSVRSVSIKPRKSATVRFYVKGSITWPDYSDFTLVYKFKFDGKTYDGHVWDDDSVYRIGRKWYRTY